MTTSSCWMFCNTVMLSANISYEVQAIFVLLELIMFVMIFFKGIIGGGIT